MPWIKKLRRDPRRCYPPKPPLRVGTGSLWECRSCGQQWRLKVDGLRADGYAQAWTWTPHEVPRASRRPPQAPRKRPPEPMPTKTYLHGPFCLRAIARCTCG